MFDDILKQMQDQIRRLNYVMTLHAEEEMNDESLTIYDVEHCILTGEIAARQVDKHSDDWKYRITGTTTNGVAMEAIAKLGPTGRCVIITVYIL